MTETQTPAFDVLHIPLPMKQRIAQTWIENLRTQKQGDSYFRVVWNTGECQMCVIGVLLDACVQHGIGQWVCTDSQDDTNICGFKMPGQFSDGSALDDWTSAMSICAQFGLLSPDHEYAYDTIGIESLPNSQSQVELIVENDSGSTFDEMLPEIQTFLAATLFDTEAMEP